MAQKVNSMENRDIARILHETAELLEIDGAIIGRYRSYEKASELIYSLHERVEELAKDRKKLTELPGIGEGMAEHIDEILKTGDYALRKKLLKKYPPTLLDVLSLQGLGPKKAAFLWKNFKAGTVEDVAKLAREQKLRDVPGFGEKTEENILRAVEFFKKSTGRFRINVAEATAAQVAAHIQALGKQIASITPAGSLRRGKETIGDLDFIVIPAGKYSQKSVDAIFDHILKYPPIQQVLAHGENKVSFLLPNGMQVDVRVIPPESYGAALLYFTGSKEHNVALRGRANAMGYTLNEYALTTLKGGKTVAGRTEAEIYAKLDLPYIEPELRENTGEIEAAEAGKLPHLVTLDDIRGDLQMHTTASDGKHSIEEMAEAARDLGYEYIALTDHSKAVTVANGLDEARTLAQIKKIRAAEKSVGGIRLFASSEVDILKDGSLDFSDEVLAQLDIVVVSIHSYMNLERAAMTERILAALENPYAQILAHPTGRLVLRRDPYDYDMERVLDACRERGVAVECNAYPDRLDLRDAHLRLAKQRGVKVVISTDAHSTTQLQVMRYGVQTARRGWLEPRDVINTLPLENFLAALRPRPGPAHKPRPSAHRRPA
ncbi:MAG: DNA polymerase/3'-5' exonuclease PolX [Candidatus Acidiferrales bacterium]